jgi:hypothetical protein
MNAGYLIYQAERTMSTAEQRAADRGAAELARSLGHLWRSAAAPFRRARRTRQPGRLTGHRVPGAQSCRRRTVASR